MSAGTEVLDRFAQTGYTLVLEGGKIRASGPTAPPEDLRALVEKNRDRLKAALLLRSPPSWLGTLEELWFSGKKTTVLRTNPVTGKAEPYEVSVSIREICTAMASAVGMDPLKWQEIREEVEEALDLAYAECEMRAYSVRQEREMIWE